MLKTKIVLLVTLLCSFTFLNAQEVYEKEFITLINEMVKDGNISSISNVGCQKGDCRVDDLVVITTDTETGVLSTLSTAVFKVKDVESFIEFKYRDGTLKEGEKRQFAIELHDIRVDGHNLLFDKPKMAQELGEKSELFLYFKKYLDRPSDGRYTLKVQKKSGNVIMEDSGILTTGEFRFGIKSRYTIKGGFEKLETLSQTNPMAVLSYVVINSIEINISNPKGFLRNLLYINYKEEIQKVKTKEERIAINNSFYLLDDTVHSQKEFGEMMRANTRIKIKELAKKDPAFNEMLNVNQQFEKKIDAILAGTSQSIDIKIDNPLGLSLGDFFTVFMGYAMQQKLAVKPDITISIK
ncbi:MAG: hypothetical protein V3S80_03085 [Sulfurimonadaceae bacterium]